MGDKVTRPARGTAAAYRKPVCGTGTESRTITLDNLTGDGTLKVTIPAGTALDNASNTAPSAGPSTAFTVDTTLTVSLGSPSDNNTSAVPQGLTLTVTYSGADNAPLVGDHVTISAT